MRKATVDVMAIASGGGHWVQLLRLRPAFEGREVLYVTTSAAYRTDVGDARFAVVPDASRWNRTGLVWCALRVLWLLVRHRPSIIVTTGAAPGYFAVVLGRRLGVRTVWLDSIANTEEVSLSGRKAGRVADLWLTQWPRLAREGGPEYQGAVL